MNIQEILNRVIDTGYYDEEASLMCWALNSAAAAGVISTEEHRQATSAINRYIGDHSILLQGALWKYALPHDYEDRLHIYRDWANRPKLERS